MPKKFYTKRGVSTLGIIVIICAVIALLVFFKTTTFDEVKQLGIDVGQGAVAVLKAIWYQVIMPIVNFLLTIFSRVVHK
ncbi:MAG: hypothetical protein WC764_03925 [Candidatus Paceibacterota bacterium]|jgi:hypothetical protein